MVVNERIVFADLAHKVLDAWLLPGLGQVVFNNMENFLLYSRRRVYVELSRWHNQQKLLVMGLRRWQSDHLEHCIQTPINFILEPSFAVVHDAEVRMADPRVD